MLSGLPASAVADRVAVQLAQSEQQDSFVRSFAYASGPAYGLLLDAAGAPWRTRIDSSSDLPTMAARAYHISVDPNSAGGRVDRYEAGRMIAEERAQDTRRIETEAKLRRTFVDGPTLTLPVAGNIAFSFDPNGAVPLPGIGIVYESSRITDAWGVLEVASGGVLLLRDADARITGIVVPAPSVSAKMVKGRGWQLALAEDWIAKESARHGSFVVSKE
jgi:hypothetical protein